MDFSTIAGILGSLATFAISTFGVLKWVSGYKSKLIVAQNVAAAAKVGAQGALDLLTELIAASDKNSLTTGDVQQIISTASDIPSALKTALKIGTIAPTQPVTMQNTISAV